MQKNIHYVSPNFRGFNYILMMLTIDELLFDYFEAFKEQWETEEVNNTEKVLDKEEHAN